ncbi:MAG: hypothetical protein LBK44_05785 [Spirochaetales bacterium]|nr:hypothetical protein [Spirochaetales bacterium]
MGAFRGRVSARYNKFLIGKRLSSGAFLAANAARNRAFRCKSSEAPMRFLWAFRCNPLRKRQLKTRQRA